MKRSWRRSLLRLELAIGVAAAILVALVWLAAPRGFHGFGPALAEDALIAAGVVGCAIGLAWMWRIYRAGTEAPGRPWRDHEAILHDGSSTEDAARTTRTWRWYAVRAELATGVAATLLTAWVVTMAARPPFGVLPSLLPVSIAGTVCCAISTAWMWRIFRADPEAGAPPWRHRDRR